MPEHSDEIEQVRERIARAIYEQGGYCGNCSFEGWDSCAECRQTLLGFAVAVLDALGLEQVGWMVWEDPQDFDSWIAAVGLDFDYEDLIHYPHRPLFTAIPPSLSGSSDQVVEQSSEGGSIPSGWPGVGGKSVTQAAPHARLTGRKDPS